jgi:UDP-N-acetylglucosamine 2-epimerase (non-hydrolysing)
VPARTATPAIAVVMGTRPEAIKLAPVIHELRRRGAAVTVISTGQHREMLTRICIDLDVKADVQLDVMRPGQTVGRLMSRLLAALDDVLDRVAPAIVVVQGDTTTALAGALSASYHRVPVAHVEAGLRSGDRLSPFPEEGNRRLIGQLAEWHFAPTERARRALLAEGVGSGDVFVTGNTVIDTLLWAVRRARHPLPPTRARRALVTMHRRENQGETMAGIARALRFLVATRDLEIVFPVHMSPAVREVVWAELDGVEGVLLIEPLDYLDLVGVLASCDLVLTDSGGLQEEAPALGKPVLVLRNETERPEAIEAGTALLVGTDPAAIVEAATSLLDDGALYASMARAINPFGDGRAARRIVDALLAPPAVTVILDRGLSQPMGLPTAATA